MDIFYLSKCGSVYDRKRQFSCFSKYSHKRSLRGGLIVNDPSLVVFTVDVSKVPYLNKQKAKTDKQQVWTFAKAVYEALPKTWTVKECYENGDLFALKFIFLIGDGMSDRVSYSPLYRLERLGEVPLTLNWETDCFSSQVPDPCILDRRLWNSICRKLNSDSFKKKAFSAD